MSTMQVLDGEDEGTRIDDVYIPPPPPPSLTFDPTGPRLMILKIVIHNFKSYGGTVVLGPFQKNFSSIVGPNGSGKSNIIDSLLFVFGYRAQKIRSQSVGVLIHNSAAHPKVSSCTVDVYFQKIIDKSENEYEVVPSSEFCVSRTAHKDNSSFYCINGGRVPFKEVSKLLRSHGIDLDYNRFLILQGEVEQISLMKPKSTNEHDTGMLEFLEDIIGSGRLKEPIELFAKKVEDLNEQRSEKIIRVKAVEKEKEELEGPKEEALEYINAKNQVVVKQHALTQFYLYECQITVQELCEKKKAFEDKMKDFLKEYKEIEDCIKEKLGNQEAVTKQYKEICKEEERVQSSFSNLELQDVQKGEELKHAVARKKELSKTLEKERLHLNELKDAPSKLEKEINELEIKSRELEQKRLEAEENLKDVMASLHTSTKNLQEEKDKHESEFMELQKLVDDASSKMSIAKVELDLYMKNGEDAKKRLKELEDGEKAVLEKEDQLKQECNSLQLNIPKMEQKLIAEQGELASVIKEEGVVLNQLRCQRAKLEEARTAIQSSQSRGKLLKALMKEKYSGQIPGIIGRLGDLGAIEDKYDVAISTACGRLDDIVTDTLRTAELCVEFLKRNNLGRATFIPLDKMQEWANYIARKFNAPPGSHRLFDLVKVQDKQVLPAFYFALRDTLVANDIDRATAIGLQGNTRHRVVTLNGEMIEASGAMSGGGDRPIRGKMGTAVVGDVYMPEQIQEMERCVDDLKQQADDISRRKLKLQESVNECKSNVSQMKHDVEKYTIERQAFTKQLEQYTALLKKQHDEVAATNPDEKVVQQLQRKLAKTEKEFNDSNETASKVKALILKLHNQIVEIGGNKMNAAQKQVQDINKEIDKITSRINKSKVDIKSVGRNVEKTEKKIASVEAGLQENVLKCEALQKALKDNEDQAREILSSIDSIKVEKDKLENELKGLKNVVKDLTSQKQSLDSKKIDIDHHLSQLVAAEDTNKYTLRALEKELSKMAIEKVEGTLPCELTELTEDELKAMDIEDYKYQVTILEEKLKNLKPNLSVIAEYKRKEQLYLQRVEELDALTKQRDNQRNHYDTLRKQRLTEFMSGFQIITYKVKETYQMLTLGGDAELELVNSLDPFSDGIIFSVRPPRKSWKNIVNLSGGEKTLSSLSLVFALHYYKPTPFYVMDEIDAALDFRNVAIVGHYIKEQTKNAQFIVISLRNNMFELAKRLVGIYKTYNTSHSVAIDVS